MKVMNCAQTRELEQAQVDKGSTYYELMENAGVSAGKILVDTMHAVESNSVAVLCGKGNNGGDGFVAAKYLRCRGFKPVILLVDGEPRTQDAVRALNGAVKEGVRVKKIWENRKRVLDYIKNADYIIDAIYGIGFKGELNEEIRNIASLANDSDAKILAVDIPSGVNCDNGFVEGVAFKADVTASFSTLKLAHILYPGMDYCGKLVVANAGINKNLIDKVPCVTKTIENSTVNNILPQQEKSANKGSVGSLLSICGSCGMAGAAVMCGKASLKSGTGLLKMAMPQGIYSIGASYIEQAVFIPLKENEQGTVSANEIERLLIEAEKSSAVVIGCGLGNNADTEQLVSSVIKYCTKPMLIDADGINSIINNADVLKQAKAPIVLTPHPGEMARLLNTTPAVVQSDRLNTAKFFAEKYNVILVLKGANTLVASKKEIYVNTTGNPGLAKGGSGDVLSGIIGAFLSMGADPYKAALAGVYCHGLAGDKCRETLGQLSMQPTDVISCLPQVYKEIFFN